MSSPETIQFTVSPPGQWSLGAPPLVTIAVDGMRNLHSWEVIRIHAYGLPAITTRSRNQLLRIIRAYLKQQTGLTVYNVDKEAVEL